MNKLEKLNTIKQAFEDRRAEFDVLAQRMMDLNRMWELFYMSVTAMPKLAECTVPSVITALKKCADLKLLPNTLNLAWIIPFQSHKKNCPRKNCECPTLAQWIPGYKGLMSLARTSHGVHHFDCSAVYEKEIEQKRFELRQGTEPYIKHDPILSGDKGMVQLIYAVAHFEKGMPKFCWLPWDSDGDSVMSIARRSKTYQRSQKKWFGPWESDPLAMGMKTVLRRLCWRDLDMNPESMLAKALVYDDDEGPGQKLAPDVEDAEFEEMKEENGKSRVDQMTEKMAKKTKTEKAKQKEEAPKEQKPQAKEKQEPSKPEPPKSKKMGEGEQPEKTPPPSKEESEGAEILAGLKEEIGGLQAEFDSRGKSAEFREIYWGCTNKTLSNFEDVDAANTVIDNLKSALSAETTK